MHFHLPKPLHGWREFAGEVGIIFVGVLLALVGESRFDEWNWHSKVDRGEEALRVQDNWDSLVLAREIVAAPCVIAQIDSFSAKLREAGPWEGMPAENRAQGPEVIRVPSAPVGDVAWQRLLADGTASHLDQKRRTLISAFQIQRAKLDEAISDTPKQRASLLFLAEPTTLDPSTRFAALRTLGEMRENTQLRAEISLEMLSNLRDLGHLSPQSRFDEALSPAPGGTIAYCRAHGLPLGDWRSQLAAFKSLQY